MEYSRGFLLRLAASFTLMSAPLAAQEQERPAPKEPESNSAYITQEPEASGFAVELHSAANWDDNILGNNAHRVRDYVFEEGALFSVWTKGPGWKLGLDYRPNGLFYRTASNFNQLDQRLNFDNEFHAGRHLLFRLKDSLDYATGVLEPQANGELSLPSGGLSNLNATLFTPFARQFANEASGEVEYDLSYRSSFNFSGGHGFRRFTGIGNANTSPAPNLFGTQSDLGGGTYSYRVTKHFTAGLEYQYQNLSFSQSFHDITHGAFLRVLWDANPYTTLSFFGGGQYSDSEGQRRMGGKWDIVITGSNARSLALQGPNGKGAFDTQAAGAALEHPLVQTLSLHLGYNYLRQRANQSVPFAVDMDRNRFTLGLFLRSHDYRF